MQSRTEPFPSPILSTSVHFQDFSVLKMGLFGSEMKPEAEFLAPQRVAWLPKCEGVAQFKAGLGSEELK